MLPRHFSPANPSGLYTLALAVPTQHMVACRLLELYRQQHAAGLCQPPNAMCWVSCWLNGKEVPRADPFRMVVPREGLLQVGRQAGCTS
jgi:hypothetical protein